MISYVLFLWYCWIICSRYDFMGTHMIMFSGAYYDFHLANKDLIKIKIKIK